MQSRAVWVWTTFALLIVISQSGCVFPSTQVLLPAEQLLERGQLVVHSDFRLPKKHRLLDELTALRTDIAEKLNLKTSDEPINIYLFENSDQYDQYLATNHPEFPHRRAFFMKTDTELKVFAYWGERVGEDLRHEVTHGYLHSIVPNMPLWLDEGIAEYYEVPKGKHGVNEVHVQLLAAKLTKGNWKPDLVELEKKIYMHELSQLDYAESWLWVHYLLETKPQRVYVLRQFLSELVCNGESQPISEILCTIDNGGELEAIEHLKTLAEGLR